MKYKLKLHYTSDELKELRELKKNYYSPMKATSEIADVGNGNNEFKNLKMKYIDTNYKDEFDFMTDINNVIMGNAIFPENKYVVHDLNTDEYVRFNMIEKTFCWSYVPRTEIKTKEEWLAINPAYEPMLEKVEE